jgi:hypothetical protein
MKKMLRRRCREEQDKEDEEKNRIKRMKRRTPKETRIRDQ